VATLDQPKEHRPLGRFTVRERKDKEKNYKEHIVQME
jgi:hypothetical protein